MRKWYVGSLFLGLSLLAITGCKVVDNAAKGSLGKGKPTPTPTPNQAPGSGGSSSFVLGQPDANTRMSLKLGLNYPECVVKVGTKLIVADFNNHRVLIYNSIPTSQTAPDVVVGQPNNSANTLNNGGIGPKTLRNPDCATSDGTRLFVADSVNHRVLIWNTIPTSDFQPADLVLGQPDFTSAVANNGGISAQSLNNPYGIYVFGTRLFVTDYSNNRVLIWNTIPTINQQAADLVLGQPDFTSNTSNNGGISAQSIGGSNRVTGDGTHLLVADYGNHRILIWNTLPTVNRQAADLVLGQPNMASAAAGLTASNLSSPIGVHSDGTHVFVNDYNNFRTLIWNTFPTVNQQAADVVLGQPNMTTGVMDNTPGFPGIPSAQSIRRAEGGLFSDGTKLFMIDARSRILIWNTIPTVNQQAADAVIGQPDFAQVAANNAGISAQLLRNPAGVDSDGTKFAVADYSNNRVLIWNSTPNTSFQAADIVIGQPNMTTNTVNTGGVSGQGMNRPIKPKFVGGKLFVADQTNARVLVWNSVPTVNQQPADYVLGQPNLNSNTSNNGGVTSQRLGDAQFVDSNGAKLFVTDYADNRILIWNTIPTVTEQPADVVVGQPNMTSNAVNNGGLSARSLSGPCHAMAAGSKFIVADYVNNRVLIWNNIPTADYQPADVVVGQPNMTSNTANNGGISASTLNTPQGVSVDGTKLYVSDRTNNRILIWNTIPTSDGQPADSVLGQVDFVSNAINGGGTFPTASVFNAPIATFFLGSTMFISDITNWRILAMPKP